MEVVGRRWMWRNKSQGDRESWQKEKWARNSSCVKAPILSSSLSPAAAVFRCSLAAACSLSSVSHTTTITSTRPIPSSAITCCKGACPPDAARTRHAGDGIEREREIKPRYTSSSCPNWGRRRLSRRGSQICGRVILLAWLVQPFWWHNPIQWRGLYRADGPKLSFLSSS